MHAALHFKKIFTEDSLLNIYLERVKDSQSKGLDRIHPASFLNVLTNELKTITKKVHSNNYKYTAYKEKLISKGANGNPRVISIPTVRDRIVLRGICTLLAHVFPEAVPKIAQIKIDELKTALASKTYQEFIKIDLREFYPSIPHDRLIKRLRTRIHKSEILDLITSALKTPTVPEHKGRRGAKDSPRGVPQGLAISNVLAEIFLGKFDKEMSAKKGIWYRRYVDDILILCEKGQSSRIGNEVCLSLESEGLKPHRLNADNSKSKAGSLTDEFEFLGYRVTNGALSVKKESIQRFEAALARIFTAYRHKVVMARSPAEARRAKDICEWRLNLRLTGCIFEGKRLGWAFYFSQVNDTSRLRAIDNTVREMLERFGLTGDIHAKRLLKTYYECRRKDKADHAYIPNFDTMPIGEQRRILGLYVGDAVVAPLTDKRVNELFRLRIKAAVKELEKDLSGAS